MGVLLTNSSIFFFKSQLICHEMNFHPNNILSLPKNEQVHFLQYSAPLFSILSAKFIKHCLKGAVQLRGFKFSLLSLNLTGSVLYKNTRQAYITRVIGGYFICPYPLL